MNRIVTEAGTSRGKRDVFKANGDRQCTIEFPKPAALQGTYIMRQKSLRKAHQIITVNTGVPFQALLRAYINLSAELIVLRVYRGADD